MDTSLARRDAIKVFRLVLVVQLVFAGLSVLALLGVGWSPGWGFLLRAAPTLLLALLFLPPWLEPVLGRYYLAVALAVDVLFSSLETAYLYVNWAALESTLGGLSSDFSAQIGAVPPIEPFFFLLIPLVLLAWGYGRRGALLGSTWAAILHLGIGIWVSSQGIFEPAVFAQSLARVALLYLVPFIVGALAERERQQHSELKVALESLRRHAATVDQLATSRERNRLARDLHDTLAHSLSALTVQLQALRTLLANDPKAAQGALDEITLLARRGLEDSRQAIQALRTDPVETMGLIGALRELLQSLEARTGMRASLSQAGQDPHLSEEEAQALYRISEEALNNVEQHSAASSVSVRLARGVDRIDLTIQDDGEGFDPSSVELVRYGLAGMRERAAMIGATLTLTSRPGAGTKVWCSLPRP